MDRARFLLKRRSRFESGEGFLVFRSISFIYGWCLFMDIKGAVFNLATLRSIYNKIDNFNYSDGFLSGVDGFNLSPLNSFKDEFSDVVKAIEFLDIQIFEKHDLEEDHQFVVNTRRDINHWRDVFKDLKERVK